MLPVQNSVNEKWGTDESWSAGGSDVGGCGHVCRNVVTSWFMDRAMGVRGVPCGRTQEE